MATSLGSLILFSSQIEAVVAFYRSLGLDFELEHHGDGAPPHFAVESNGVHFAVFEAPPGSAARFREGGCTWPGFVVDDLDATLEQLKSDGAKVLVEPEERPWGVRAIVEDPDGRPVELWSV